MSVCFATVALAIVATCPDVMPVIVPSAKKNGPYTF
jgi:hypothetical protein